MDGFRAFTKIEIALGFVFVMAFLRFGCEFCGKFDIFMIIFEGLKKF